MLIIIVVVVVALFAQQYNSTRFYIDTVERSRTARSDKTTSSCSKTFSKTVTYGVHNYYTSKILKTKGENWKMNLFNAILKRKLENESFQCYS